MTVDDYIWDLLRSTCEKHGLRPGQLFGGKHTKKTPPIVAARMEFVRTMRAEVWHNGNLLMLRESAEEFQHLGWKPISFPALGELLGLDHSTLVLMNGRAKRKETEAQCLNEI